MDRNSIIFLSWLYSRLLYKHKYSIDDPVLVQLDKIIKDLKEQIEPIDKESLVKILSKYYIDFNLDYCETFPIGYTEQNREKLIETTLNIIDDVINKKVPKDYIIKG